MHPTPTIVILWNRIRDKDISKKEVKDGLCENDKIIHFVGVSIANIDAVCHQY